MTLLIVVGTLMLTQVPSYLACGSEVGLGKDRKEELASA